MSANLASVLYLVSGVLFILALRGLSSPETSRLGNRLGMVGMGIAVLTTLAVLAPQGALDPVTDAMIVVGSPNSSNSQRLREVAERCGAPAQLVQARGDIDWNIFSKVSSLGISAGASAPEVLVEEIMEAFAERFEIHVESVSAADENVSFPLPKELRAIA